MYRPYHDKLVWLLAKLDIRSAKEAVAMMGFLRGHIGLHPPVVKTYTRRVKV
jgi:hypothetical protein